MDAPYNNKNKESFITMSNQLFEVRITRANLCKIEIKVESVMFCCMGGWMRESNVSFKEASARKTWKLI